MVSVAAEVEEARALFLACLADLEAEGVPAAMPPLGVMVETPAAALTPTCCAPTSCRSAATTSPSTSWPPPATPGAGWARSTTRWPPPSSRLIASVVRHGRETGVPVSLCGDMASDPRGLEALLGLGLRRVSVAPAALGRVKLAVGEFSAARG